MSSYKCDPMQACKGFNQRRGVTVSGQYIVLYRSVADPGEGPGDPDPP